MAGMELFTLLYLSIIIVPLIFVARRLVSLNVADSHSGHSGV